ncbi:MAG: tetratricopeptide repeat protein [Acidobacteria bacterium]|nr:tetratricopeptide repeat protein [Acidobacteriota bacterium]
MSRRINFERALAAFAALLALLLLPAPAAAQAGGHTLFGDLKVDESRAEGVRPISFEVVLYAEGGALLSRQAVNNNSRYRFLNLQNGRYDLAVELEGEEIGRIRVWVQSAYKTDHRQDINLEWRERHGGARPQRAQTVSAADFYKRTPAGKALFEKAQHALDNRRYEEAVSLLGQLVAADAEDFQAWTELGTARLMQDDAAGAEEAYRRAAAARPGFTLALLNLGRLLSAQRRYAEAVEPLAGAVRSRPDSAEANYLLAEAYLQIRKGSKAVVYFNEALRLDPQGRAEAHLRLATLYNAAGYKGRAAEEYRKFLAKRPDYPERKRLERYIAENTKP